MQQGIRFTIFFTAEDAESTEVKKQIRENSKEETKQLTAESTKIIGGFEYLDFSAFSAHSAVNQELLTAEDAEHAEVKERIR